MNKMPMNNIKDCSINNCTSCQMCSVVCPHDAITIKLDEYGFYTPVVDKKKCIGCGRCKQFCYKYENNIKMTYETKIIDVYAGQSREKDLLLSSSSGGVSTLIAKECLKQGYKIIGVKYDTEQDIAVNYIADNEIDIQTFRGSKYMQSYTEKAFRKMLSDETEQKFAVFGTPCQIYAIRKYIKKHGKENQFLLVDIFCHGCPSINLWKRYLQHIKKEFNVEKFDKIEFRSKIYGWHEYSHYFIKDNVGYKSKKINDPFFTIYFDNSVLSKSCYDCKIRSTLEYTDIRLGDFWGNEYILNKEGVSAVILVSEKGKDIFCKIKDKLFIKKHTLDEVCKFQTFGKEYYCNENLRIKTLELLKTNKDMNSIMKENKKYYTLKKRIKLLIKQSTYFLPDFIRYKIKSFYYGL